MQKNTEKQWFNNGVCVAFALSGNSLLIKKKKKKNVKLYFTITVNYCEWYIVYIVFLRPCGKSCPCYPLAKGHWAYFLWAFWGSSSLFPWCHLIALEQEEKITEMYFVTKNMFYVKHHYVVCECVINYSENGLVVVDPIKISKIIISR